MSIKKKLKEILKTLPSLKFCVVIILLSTGYSLKCFYHKVPELILIKIIAIATILIPVTRLINIKLGEKYRLYIAPFILISVSLSMLLLNYNLSLWIFLGACCFGICCLLDIINNDVAQQLEQLENIRTEMERMFEPDKMLTRLSVDVLKIRIGMGIIPVADPEQGGFLLEKIGALRQRLTDNYGYIIPKVRILDSEKLDSYEYEIYVRDKSVAKGIVYPDKQRVFATEWEEKIRYTPNDVIVDIEPVAQRKIYWIDRKLVQKYGNRIQSDSPDDIIIQHLEYCTIKYVDEILSDVDIEKYIKLVESTNPTLTKYLTEHLSVIDIRKIFANLIKDNLSVKDIHLIFLKLCEYVQITNNIDLLTEKLKKILTKCN